MTGCLGNGTAGGASSTTVVAMTDEPVFEREAATIQTSDTVQWRNTGDIKHMVTAEEGESGAGSIILGGEIR